MVRVEEWPRILGEYLVERKAMPFSWGTNDCIQFAFQCVKQLTGVDFPSQYPEYSDEAGAREIMDAHGGVIGLISEVLGEGSRNVLTGKRGDVVIAKLPEVTAGIIDDSGENIIIVTQYNGTLRLPLKTAWRVWSY